MKEIIEKIQDLKYNYDDTAYSNAIDDVVEILEQQTQWISVEDSLPELEQDVLVSSNGSVCVAFMYNKDYGFYCSSDDTFLNPTHWQPLPKPPQ